MGPGFDTNSYYQLAFCGNGASVLEWYQKNYAPDLTIPQLIALASLSNADVSALPCANNYPDLKGFRPSQGNFSHGHYARAILDSVASSLHELTTKLCGNELPSTIIATGGGAKSDLWLKIKAQILGVKMLRSDCDEPACRGAAMAAVVSLWFRSVEQCQRQWLVI